MYKSLHQAYPILEYPVPLSLIIGASRDMIAIQKVVLGQDSVATCWSG